MQILAAFACLALFAWALSKAFSPANRAELAPLADAPLWQPALLLILTLGSIALNGVIFWITLLPARRISAVDCVAVNALATLLALLPGKLSLVARVLTHRRRHHLPYKLIIAWFAATAGLSVGVLGSMAVLSAWRGDFDAVWIAGAAAACAAFLTAAVLGARFVAARPRLHAFTLGAADLAVAPATPAAHMAARVLDVLLQAGRFWVVAAALGHAMPIDEALLLSSVYFLTGVLSPAGNLGAREGAVMGVGAVALSLGHGQLAQVAIVVTAAEAACAAAVSVWAAWRLRIDRIIKGGPPGPTGPGGLKPSRPDPA